MKLGRDVGRKPDSESGMFGMPDGSPRPTGRRAKLQKPHLNPTFQLGLILAWLGIAQGLKDKFQFAAGCLTYHLSLKILATEATVKFPLQVWLAKAEESLWFKLLADFLMPWDIPTV